MNAPLLFSPSDAQERYDFTGSLLRRYALIYEELGGTIHRDKRGGRLYTQEQLEHFKMATERVAAGETVEDALKTLNPSEELAAQGETLSEAGFSGEALEVLRQVLSTQHDLLGAHKELLSEVQGMREELRQAVTTQAELERLRREVAEVKASRGVLGVLEQVRSYVAERVKGR